MHLLPIRWTGAKKPSSRSLSTKHFCLCSFVSVLRTGLRWKDINSALQKYQQRGKI